MLVCSWEPEGPRERVPLSPSLTASSRLRPREEQREFGAARGGNWEGKREGGRGGAGARTRILKWTYLATC